MLSNNITSSYSLAELVTSVNFALVTYLLDSGLACKRYTQLSNPSNQNKPKHFSSARPFNGRTVTLVAPSLPHPLRLALLEIRASGG